MYPNYLVVNFKKLYTDVKLPTQADSGSAGWDIYAQSYKEVKNLYVEYGTGLQLEIPSGYVGLIFPRSSIANTNMSLANAVAVIDSSFRGEIMLRYRHAFLVGANLEYVREYEIGDKIAQLIILPYPKVVFNETNELSTTDRGDKGFGSSGE